MNLFEQIISAIERTKCDPGTSKLVLNLDDYLNLDVAHKKQLYRSFYQFEASATVPCDSFGIREHA